MAKTKKKPCPPTGPASDGRGQGRGMPGGSRRGRKNPQGRGGRRK